MADDTTQQPEPLCSSADLPERGRAWVWDVTQYGRPARAFALRIACNPSFAVRMAKRLIWDAQSMSIAQILEMSAAMQAVAHATKDNAEAVNAFIEKRKPVFTGD